MTVVRVGKIRTALRTNQIKGFVAVLFYKIKTGILDNEFLIPWSFCNGLKKKKCVKNTSQRADHHVN